MSQFIKIPWSMFDEEWTNNDRALARWLRTNLEAERARSLRRRPYLPERVWLSILERFRGCCAYCGTTGVPLHKDHHVPFSKGGATDETNIVPACVPCNARKSNADPLNWPLMVPTDG